MRTPFFGGQASVALLGIYGRNDTSLNATAAATLGPLSAARSIALSDTTTGFGDLIPQFAVRWNSGVNNFMTYLTGDIPVGKYDLSDLANIGIGHGALDGGVGYTYFNPQTGQEFSATFGLTGNFKNQSTGYTNGIDSHLDLGLSQFVTKQLQIGAVGYLYDQLTSDSGCAPVLCPFKSRVAGVGPQIGYIFPRRHHARLRERKGLQGVRRPEQTGRLEYVGDIGAVASACRRGAVTANSQKVTPSHPHEGAGTLAHAAVNPPSSTRTWPVIDAAAGLMR